MAVHHQCIEPFNLQTPRESECVDNAHGCVVKDNLSPGGRKRLISLGEDSKEAVICLTCVDKLTKKKATGKKKVTDGTHESYTRGLYAPRKPKKINIPKADTLRELRRTAAFYAQTFVFGKKERTNNTVKYLKIAQQFYGDSSLNIVGCLNQLVGGHGPFAALYTVKEGDNSIDKVLKESVCAKDTGSFYIAGQNFSASLLSLSFYKDPTSKLLGRSIWENANDVTKNIKKAISLIPKLKGKLVIVDSNYAVEGYVSGHNEAQFFQYIKDGMYAMSREYPERNKVEQGFDQLEEGTPTDPQQDPSAVDGTDTVSSIPKLPNLENNTNNTANATFENNDDGNATENDMQDPEEIIDSVQTVAKGGSKGYLGSSDRDWDPFDGVRAPDGWSFNGFMAFTCLGPTTSYFALVLKMGGSGMLHKDKKSTKGAAKKFQGRANMRKTTEESDALERATGGTGRGMTMHTKVNLAAVAQGEDDADTRDTDREFAATTQQIATHQGLLSVQMKLLEFATSEQMKKDVFNKIGEYTKRIEQLDVKIAQISNKKRKKNVIVEAVLNHGAVSLGIKRDKNDGIQVHAGTGVVQDGGVDGNTEESC